MAFDEAYNEPENVEVLVKSLDPDHPAELYYAHAGDAGADLRTTEEVTLKPFQRALVPTGVAIALPAGYVALVHPRSCRQAGCDCAQCAGNHRRGVPW